MLVLAGAAVVLGGCTALVVGGAGGGARDERPASPIADDSSITAAVRSRLAADRYVGQFDVAVATYNGRVTLSGTVGSTVARDQAGRLAAGVDGVSAVTNNLKVGTE